jgi:hypothetical protein
MKNDICGDACACTSTEPTVAIAATTTIGITLRM